MFRLCSARARKTVKDAHHQPSVLHEVRHTITNISPDDRQLGPTTPRSTRTPRLCEPPHEVGGWVMRRDVALNVETVPHPVQAAALEGSELHEVLARPVDSWIRVRTSRHVQESI